MVKMSELFGLIGLVLIVVAWLPGVLETIRNKKTSMKPVFIALYFLGSASLTFYSIQLQALPFIILNALATLVPLVHLYYHHKQKA